MSDVTTNGLDRAKNVFQVHAADGPGHALTVNLKHLVGRLSLPRGAKQPEVEYEPA
jgi:hypothetical protein